MKMVIILLGIAALLLLGSSGFCLPAFQSPPPTMTATPTKSILPPQPTITLIKPKPNYLFYLPDMKVNLIGSWWPMGE